MMELLKTLNQKISWFRWDISRNSLAEIQLTAQSGGASVIICHSRQETDIIAAMQRILQGKRIL